MRELLHYGTMGSPCGEGLMQKTENLAWEAKVVCV